MHSDSTVRAIDSTGAAYHKAEDVAAMFGCHRQTLIRIAKRLGVGMNLGGRAGFRFSDDDVAVIREALRPKVVTKRRRSA